METIEQLIKRAEGITKKEIAAMMDKANPLFNFCSKGSPGHFSHYTRTELLSICFDFRIDPVSDYHKNRTMIISA